MITAALKENLAAEVQMRQFKMRSDVNATLGGNDTAPNPHELLQAALAACTIITVQMYAKRKGWPVDAIDVKINIESETREGTVITREMHFGGANLTAEQRTQLLAIADKCPIHRLLTGKIEIRDVVV